MLYAAKCYWPGVTETELKQVPSGAAHDVTSNGRNRVTYLGSLLFSDDDLVLCLFEARTPTAVKHASGRLGIPCERVMDSIWLNPRRPT